MKYTVRYTNNEGKIIIEKLSAQKIRSLIKSDIKSTIETRPFENMPLKLHNEIAEHGKKFD